jgi:ribonuclease VapC
MIAIDTSALMAIVMNEPEADACISAIEQADRLLISAVTVAEAMIVASRRNVGEEMTRLVEGLGFEVIDLNEKSARSVAEAYEKWGKGAHPAALNFGDCFSYVAAKANSCRLLYIGEDFNLTDLESALPPPAPKK